MAVLSVHTKMRVSSHTLSREHQVRVRFTGPFRNVGQCKDSASCYPSDT